MTFSNGTRVTMARDLAPLVKLLGDETIRRGYDIRRGVTGGYNCRPLRGGTSYSNHAFALAIDINWDKNPMSSRLVTDMPQWMVDLWTGFGFRWGGGYRNRKDAMHYEFMGTPADARRAAERARKAFTSPTPTPTPTEEDDDVKMLGYVKTHNHGAVYKRYSNGTKLWIPDPGTMKVEEFANGGPLKIETMPDDSWMRGTGPIVGPRPDGVDGWGCKV